MNVIAQVAQAVPLVDPVVTDIALVAIGFDQTKSEQSTIDHLDPIVDIIRIVDLPSRDSDGGG